MGFPPHLGIAHAAGRVGDAFAMPADLVMPMTHDVPLLWRTAGGRERLASLPGVTQVALRGVDPGAIDYGENGLGQPKAGHRGRVWFPYGVAARPGGLAPEAFAAECAVAPPPAFSIRFPGAQARGGTAYPAPAQAVARAIEMPEEKAGAWVRRTVAEDMMHDGRIVWVADPLGRTDGAGDPVRQEEAALHRLVMVQGLRVLRDAGEMLVGNRTLGLDDAMARTRRLVVRACIGDIGREQRHTALEVLAALAEGMIGARNHYAPDQARARRLAGDARLMAASTGAIRIPEEDGEALATLRP